MGGDRLVETLMRPEGLGSVAVEAADLSVGKEDEGGATLAAEGLERLVVVGAGGGEDHLDAGSDEYFWPIVEGEEGIAVGDGILQVMTRAFSQHYGELASNATVLLTDAIAEKLPVPNDGDGVRVTG